MTVPLLALGSFVGLILGLWLTAAAVVDRLAERLNVQLSHHWRQMLGAIRDSRMGRISRGLGIGMLGGALLTGSGPSLPVGIMVGGSAGFLFAQWTAAMHRRRLHAVRVREMLLLYDAIDRYARAGYSLHDALEAAANLTPLLRPVVARCLHRWPQGPLRALARFQDEVMLTESELVIPILQQALHVGVARLPELLSEEVEKLERLRQHAAEEQLALRPLYLTLYLALPGFTLVGMIFFPFGFHSIQMIQQLQAF